MAVQFNPEQAARAGRWEKQTGPETYHCFIPSPLPPKPALNLESLQDASEKANRALGRLDEITALLPDPALFLYSYVRKEAVLSSQIEGTQSSLSDLLLFEAEEESSVPIDDVRQVSNYVAAMDHGLARLKSGFPLSLRLLKEIHAKLMAGTRGGDKEHGEFRRSQNWVGGTRPGVARYVGPPPHEVMPALGTLEKFLHDDPVRTPAVLKAGLAHAQFESIHPFLDGNGRLGRLLITFILCAEGALSQPLLYLSLYLKEHREEYYDALQSVRTHGDWERWLRFYLEGVEAASRQAAETARSLTRLFEEDRKRIEAIGKMSVTALKVHEMIKKDIRVSLMEAHRRLKVSVPTAARSIAKLEELGVLRELTGHRRNRVFVYDEYLKRL
ncbi:MAG: Fic family protein [Elusimicrobia bacterium]|nr:Fic family protein [Elusimicrobiota bacterium]